MSHEKPYDSVVLISVGRNFSKFLRLIDDNKTSKGEKAGIELKKEITISVAVERVKEQWLRIQGLTSKSIKE